MGLESVPRAAHRSSLDLGSKVGCSLWILQGPCSMSGGRDSVLFTFVRLERCLVYSRGSVIAVGRRMLPDCAGTRCGVGVGSLLVEIVARALTRVTNPLQASL